MGRELWRRDRWFCTRVFLDSVEKPSSLQNTCFLGEKLQKLGGTGWWKAHRFQARGSVFSLSLTPLAAAPGTPLGAISQAVATVDAVPIYNLPQGLDTACSALSPTLKECKGAWATWRRSAENARLAAVRNKTSAVRILARITRRVNVLATLTPGPCHCLLGPQSRTAGTACSALSPALQEFKGAWATWRRSAENARCARDCGIVIPRGIACNVFDIDVHYVIRKHVIRVLIRVLPYYEIWTWSTERIANNLLVRTSGQILTCIKYARFFLSGWQI
jgi:hypothetical protein